MAPAVLVEPLAHEPPTRARKVLNAFRTHRLRKAAKAKMAASASVNTEAPETQAYVERLAFRMASGDKSAFNPMKVGREFRMEQGAEMNPIKDIAVGFILVGIALVIALTILPVITSAVNTAQNDGNISSSDSTLLGLLPTLLIVGLLAGGVAFLFRGFRAIKS